MSSKRSDYVSAALLALSFCRRAGARRRGRGLRPARTAKPLWIDYAEGSVGFRQAVFAPVRASSPPPRARPRAGRAPPGRRADRLLAHEARRSSSARRPAPADPATITGAAQKLFDKAVACDGLRDAADRAERAERRLDDDAVDDDERAYRQNILDLLRAALGLAAPSRSCSSTRSPYTGGDAAGWWREAAQVADLVPEVYFNAPVIMRQGVDPRQPPDAHAPPRGGRGVHGDRDPGLEARLRARLPVRARASGGREGLQPSSAWFEYAKLYTLAARRVAAEFGVATVWTWGWGTFNAAGADPDKQAAACVYLWTRDQSLCDGPTAAGRSFDDSLTEGQIDAAAGHSVQLRRASDAPDRPFEDDGGHPRPRRRLHDPLRPPGGGELAQIPPTASARPMQAIVDGASPGSRPAFNAALAKAGANIYVARAAIADELLRAQIQGSISVPAPTGAQMLSLLHLVP